MFERDIGGSCAFVASAAGPDVLWRGGDGPKVLILGRHDTVFQMGTLADRPFTVADGSATGPGVFDMLGGIVQALHGLAALQRAAGHISGVELLFSADEEVGSHESRELLEARARACGRVLVPQPPAAGRPLKTGPHGCGTLRVVLSRPRAHARPHAPPQRPPPLFVHEGGGAAGRSPPPAPPLCFA